ncbi:MAG: monovalent cation/H(+) antiporter subunit G [Halanaerobiales bacterium]
MLRLIISYILMTAGAVFAVITVIGLIRFPDVYTRIHAAAVVLTISAVLITFGIAIYVWKFYLSLKILLISLFFLASNPMATHAIARASYKKKIALPKINTVDEYSKYLERGEER